MYKKRIDRAGNYRYKKCIDGARNIGIKTI